MPDATDYLWGFLAALRQSGVRVAMPKQADFWRAVGQSPPRDLTALYWRARITLLGGVEDLATFDHVFDAWFRQGRVAVVPPPAPEEGEQRSPDDSGDGELPAQGAMPGDGLQASAVRIVRRRSFGDVDARQRRLMRELEDAWLARLPSTRSRRRRPARAGDRLDMRRIWRQAGRHDGEIIELRRRVRPPRPRRLLLLVDVSGSQRQHSPELLLLAHTALRAAPGRTEVFTFGTRLTRVTAALAGARPDRALGAVSELVLDADGGTAIGASLQQFLANSRYVSLARGAMVIVLSDGLERGDCTAMARSAERLARLAHRLVWWSPLACSPTYRPVTRGMAAVLPNIDRLSGVRDLPTGLAEIRRLEKL